MVGVEVVAGTTRRTKTQGKTYSCARQTRAVPGARAATILRNSTSPLSAGNDGAVTSLGGGSDFTNTRSPTLRDLVDANGSPRGGFMHDASLPTLLSVIDHYNAIPASRCG